MSFFQVKIIEKTHIRKTNKRINQLVKNASRKEWFKAVSSRIRHHQRYKFVFCASWFVQTEIFLFIIEPHLKEICHLKLTFLD